MNMTSHVLKSELHTPDFQGEYETKNQSAEFVDRIICKCLHFTNELAALRPNSSAAEVPELMSTAVGTAAEAGPGD
jgi:hypothetical protein